MLVGSSCKSEVSVTESQKAISRMTQDKAVNATQAGVRSGPADS